MSFMVMGKNIPKNCYDCVCHNEECGTCNIIEIPENHGRLIDEDDVKYAFRDAIVREAIDNYGKLRATKSEVNKVIDSVKTIIPREVNVC